MRYLFIGCLMFCACANTVPQQPIIENHLPPPETSTLERNIDATVVVYIRYLDTALRRFETHATAGVVINKRNVLLVMPQVIYENLDLIKIREVRIGPPGVNYLQAPWKGEVAAVAVLDSRLMLVRAREDLPRPSVLLSQDLPKKNEILYAVSVSTANDTKTNVGRAVYKTRAMVLKEKPRYVYWNDVAIAFKNFNRSGPPDLITGNAGIFNKKHEMVGFGVFSREKFHLISEIERAFFDESWDIIGNVIYSSKFDIIIFLNDAGVSYSAVRL